MLHETDINALMDKLDALQASVNTIAETVARMQQNKAAFDEWVSEKETISITGLSRSTLLKLRNAGKVRNSTLTGKQPYYKLSDFKKLLDKNEFEL